MTLTGIARLLIDGNNLLHRTSGSVEPGAQRLLLARLSDVIPPTIEIIVMLDGHAAPSTDRRQRVRRGLEIHHAGSLSADDALLNIVRDAAASERSSMTLVSDDRALYEKARYLGVRTQRLAWLEAILERRRSRPAAPRDDADEPEREPWKPGRGATTKRGNPRRGKR